MKLKKEFIGSVVTITDPLKISIEVKELNAELLLKFKLNHLFENDNNTDNIDSKPSGTNVKRKK